MNDLTKPDLKQGVPLSCIPEVGHRRRMQRKLKFQSAAICAVVIMMATCRGLAPEPASGYVIKNFTVEDGLLSNEVNVILQTRDGFLWIGTAEGLLRFDGRHFTPIKFLPQASPILVRALAEGPDGALWVGTPGGLARISSGGSSEPDHTVTSLYHPGSGDGDSVQCLHFSRNGDLWVGTLTGLYRFEHGKFLLMATRRGMARWSSTG